MPTIADIRHANLLKLIEEHDGSITKLASAVERDYSQISQLKNRNKHSTSDKNRDIGDDLARWFESKTGKPAGWMDTYWPFLTVDIERFERLRPQERGIVEGAMSSAIRDCEAARKTQSA